MIDRSIPPQLAGLWLQPLAVTSAIAAPPGMSGGQTYRCGSAVNAAQFALKRWPPGVTLPRVREVHRVIRTAIAGGCEFVPAPLFDVDTCVAIDGTVWDLLSWQPGAPLERTADPRLIRRGTAAIARFHAAVRPIACRRGIAPAITDRQRRLEELAGILPTLLTLTAAVPDATPLGCAIRRAGALFGARWSIASRALRRLLSPFAERPTALQIVLRDVHRQHLLFESNQVTGLIDFDALRMDSPATDLARWLGGFMRADQGWREWGRLAAGGGGQVGEERTGGGQPAAADPEFSAEQIAMARAIAAANPWLSLANWLVWLLLEKRHFAAGEQVVARRLNEWIDQIVNLATPEPD